ncbi:hypothetical protein A6A06_04760 [Streptomyces sp. CB02923]|nr:hypothetical protein A6A06_04760 [Streptomyces sp. CB02923]
MLLTGTALRPGAPARLLAAPVAVPVVGVVTIVRTGKTTGKLYGQRPRVPGPAHVAHHIPYRCGDRLGDRLGGLPSGRYGPLGNGTHGLADDRCPGHRVRVRPSAALQFPPGPGR